MRKLYNLIRPATLIAVLIFVFLIISQPDVCSKGTAKGILISGRVIIPSLFPFTFCLLFIIKSGITEYLEFLKPVTARLFRQSPEQFAVMLLSFVGGYPIGAKLIDELVATKKISTKNGRIMQLFCVNAGPAFIVAAVGSSLLGSQRLGYILLVSHIASSLILALTLKGFMADEISGNFKAQHIGMADNFVLSAGEAASAVFGICGYVILFSAINAYIEFLSQKISFIKYAAYLFEVTNGISLTDNILLISFLLGFAGFSVWFQILSVSRNTGVTPLPFITARIFHGLLSVCFTAVILRVFRVPLPAFSTSSYFSGEMFYTGAALSLSMVCMAIVFLISVSVKKYSRKLFKDLI